MNRSQQLHRVLECGLIAALRTADGHHVVDVARALVDGGVTVLEVPLTMSDALDGIRKINRAFGDRVLVGAGAVLDTESARIALLAGAEFISSPTFDLQVVRMCRRYDNLVIPGAFTPTEILAAWESGADIVKVFPADVAGPAFFRAMRSQLPQLRLMPTGGVNLDSAAEFLKAGAFCLSVGSQLVDPKLVAAGDYDRLRDHAKQYAAVVKAARMPSG